MLAENLTREELEKSAKELRDNLKNRLEQIEKKYENPPRSALNNFNRLSTEYTKDIDEMTDKELNNYYRDLKYIDNLKSSKPEEIPRIIKEWLPIKDIIDQLPPHLRKKTWDTVDLLYGTIGKNMEYRYHYIKAVAMRYQTEKYTNPKELALRLDAELRESQKQARRNLESGVGETDPNAIFYSRTSSAYYTQHTKGKRRYKR